LISNLEKLNALTGKDNKKYKRKNIKNKVPPLISTKPQRYGYGSAIRFISSGYIIPTETLQTFPLGTDLSDNTEFLKFAEDYHYCKLLAIKVIVRPFNFVNSTKAVYFKMNWSNSYETAASVRASDVSKMVGSLNPKPTIFTFLPPQISYGGAAIPNYYVQCLATNYIFTLNAVSGFSSSIDINVEFVLRFRTPRDYAQSSKITSLRKEIINEIKEMDKLNQPKIQKEIEEINEEEEEKEINEPPKRNKKKNY
jgi:hypothetical protein